MTVALGAAGVAAGCLPLASACSGYVVLVRPTDDPSPFYRSESLPTVTAGETVAVVGYGFARCDDTGGELCSQNGRVTGSRDATVTWRVPGQEPRTLAQARIEDGGTVLVDVVVPADGAPGAGQLVLQQAADGGTATVDVQVVASR